jgi:hypothetical protein
LDSSQISVEEGVGAPRQTGGSAMISAIAVAGWVVAGAASAFGGWAFHKIFKTKQQVAKLEDRVNLLEP